MVIVGGGVLALFRPGVAIGVLLCTYGLEQALQAHSAWFGVHQTAVNYATALLVLFTAAALFVRGRLRAVRYPPVGWLVLGLLAWAAASTLWSVDRTETIAQIVRFAPYLGAFCVLMPLCMVNMRDVRDAFWTVLLLGAALLALMSRAEWQGRSVILELGPGGEGGNPLAIASLAGQVAIIVVLMNYAGVARVWQVMRWFLLALALYIGVRSGSRGQVLAMIVCIAVFLPFSRRLKRLSGWFGAMTAMAVFGTVAYWIMTQFATDGRWDIASMQEAYAGGRMDMVGQVLAAWANAGPARWVMGLGSSASFKLVGYYPHFVPGEILAELGLVGFTLYLAILVLTARALWQLYQRCRDFNEARGLVVTLAGLVIFELILTCKQGSMLGSPVFFGLLILVSRIDRQVVGQAVSPVRSASSIERVPAGFASPNSLYAGNAGPFEERAP
ncbi:MAG: O-antigen ligase family protein [Phycisphaeraceae bacterium]